MHLDLAPNELELRIERCANLVPPKGWTAKDMEVYVHYQLPYPSETTPQEGDIRSKEKVC